MPDLNPVGLSPIFQRPTPTAGLLPPKSPRLAGLRRVAPLIGPGITAGVAGYRLSQGERPQEVLVGTGIEEGASALGAGIGFTLGGPPGAVVGGILAPVVTALTLSEDGKYTRPVDLSALTTDDIRYMAASNPTSAAGLTAGYKPPYRTVQELIANPALDQLNQYLSQSRAAQATQASNQNQTTQSAQAARTAQVSQSPATTPASVRPSQEQRPPISRQVPATSTTAPEERVVENDLAQLYAQQYKLGRAMEQSGELQRLLREGMDSGAVSRMADADLMSWVGANPALAYRLAERKGLLPTAVQ